MLWAQLEGFILPQPLARSAGGEGSSLGSQVASPRSGGAFGSFSASSSCSEPQNSSRGRSFSAFRPPLPLAGITLEGAAPAPTSCSLPLPSLCSRGWVWIPAPELCNELGGLCEANAALPGLCQGERAEGNSSKAIQSSSVPLSSTHRPGSLGVAPALAVVLALAAWGLVPILAAVPTLAA